MRISEIFFSVQGEGSLVGVPSVFIRTSGCNLRCSWCDTPYTSWSPEGSDAGMDDILAAVQQFGARHVVVTGGEPMIAPDLVSLTGALRESGFHITIETAGTVFHRVACDLMSISPKLANSTPFTREDGRWAAQHDRLRFQPVVLRELVASYPAQLKFVIASPDDLPEVKAVVEAAGASKGQVILMPEGIDRDTLQQRSRWLVEICKTEGYRFSPRLHVDLWGAQRGV